MLSKSLAEKVICCTLLDMYPSCSSTRKGNDLACSATRFFNVVEFPATLLLVVVCEMVAPEDVECKETFSWEGTETSHYIS